MEMEPNRWAAIVWLRSGHLYSLLSGYEIIMMTVITIMNRWIDESATRQFDRSAMN